MISGTTSYYGITGFSGMSGTFSLKNENAQTRNVITEKYKEPGPIMSITGGTYVFGSVCYSGATTINFLTEIYR